MIASFCRICASKYSRLLEAETNGKSELDDAGEEGGDEEGEGGGDENNDEEEDTQDMDERWRRKDDEGISNGEGRG